MPSTPADAYENLVTEVRRRAERRPLPSAPERRQIRLAARVSLRAAGRAIGVSAMSVHRWELGTDEPTPEHAEVYARLLRDLAEVAA